MWAREVEYKARGMEDESENKLKVIYDKEEAGTSSPATALRL